MLQGVRMACQLSIGKAKFATDCINLRDAVTSTSYDLSQVGATVKEIKGLLASSFIDYQVLYVPRNCNKPAHTLAAIGSAGEQNNHQVWFDHVPVTVSRALYGDSAVQV